MSCECSPTVLSNGVELHSTTCPAVNPRPLLIRADWFGRPNWHCSVCQCNYSTGDHVPGSAYCEESRRERFESITADD